MCEEGSGVIARVFGAIRDIVGCFGPRSAVHSVHVPSDLELEREVEPDRAK
jgi:hypothetical protein